MLLLRVPNIPRDPFAILRKEVRAVPQALKPYLTSLNLALDIKYTADLKTGCLIAAHSPKLATGVPSSSIFHGTSLTTTITDSPTYVFLEASTLFDTRSLSQDAFFAALASELADEVTSNSIVITRRVTAQDFCLLNYIFACPRHSLARIMNVVRCPSNERQTIVQWAGSITNIDDFAEQSDHLLITVPKSTRTPAPPSTIISHPLTMLTRDIQKIGGNGEYIALPTSLNSICVTCPRGTLAPGLIMHMPRKYQITNLSTYAPSHLARPFEKALMVYPALRVSQSECPRTILDQLETMLHVLFETGEIERRQHGFRISQLEESDLWRNFEGYLGPLKVRMSLEAEKQDASDAWWYRLGDREQKQLNDLRREKLSKISALHPTLDRSATLKDQLKRERPPSDSDQSPKSRTRISSDDQTQSAPSP